MHKPLITIVGPTASGKSALAVEIAKAYNGEIICADSRTIYKGMDIGTAKPTDAVRAVVPHHLLDIVAPDETFTAAEFKRRAEEVLDDIWRRGKIPILVGGSGLYIDAILFDYAFGPLADPIQRAALQSYSIEELHALCVDRNIALPKNSKNKRHIVRAIETGGILQQPKKLRSNTIVVGITIDKEELLSRMTQRTKEMLAQGVVEEAKALAARYGWESEALTGNVYRILQHYVVSGRPAELAIPEIVASDARLAKRQLTWFKRNPYIIWGTAEELRKVVEHFVQQNILDESMLLNQ